MRNCDIVMKGGITSGVVYPLAIVELAQEFRFRNIGGTSAGAIAAAMTAAAEYRRITTGASDGFDVLATLPEFLAGTTDGAPNLLGLFPPAPKTRRLFAIVEALLGSGSKLRVIPRLLAVSPLRSLLAFVPAIALAVVLAREPMHIAALLALVAIELLLIAGGFAALAALTAYRAAFVTLPENGFGFSLGRAPAGRKQPGVTDWLHETLQRTAGRAADDAPLTFADLWTAGTTATVDECEHEPELRAINLQMITTALSHGRPYRLPFENRRFSFREDEMRAHFPDAIVKHLVARGGTPSHDGFIPLPPPAELPIVVAARMSLSFPVLFAMVPLYAVDYTRHSNQSGEPHPERCWFIDGGLSSNFPVTLFDSVLPRWPTFAVDLSEFHPDYPKDEHDESNNVWMVKGNGNGTSDRWIRFAGFAGYISAMLDTIRNWRDNTQLTVPGFRDRIAHVKLSEEEGGLNLDMNERCVRSLAQRGRWAGVKLRERFGAAGATRRGLNWNTHRVARYRIAVALLRRSLRQLDEAFTESDEPYPSYESLVSHDRDAFLTLSRELLAVARGIEATPAQFEEKAPRPTPELRITPRL
jgi:hypothetical protein